MVLPVLIGFVRGPMLEENLRRAMLLARGDFTVVASRPVTSVLLAISALLLIRMIWRALKVVKKAPAPPG